MGNSGTESAVFLELVQWLDTEGYRFFVHIPSHHETTGVYPQILSTCQTHSIGIGSYKPDILGFTPANRVFAVEVKGGSDLRKGLGQAISYQRGVDHAYLAASAGQLGSLHEIALSKGIGVFEVGSGVEASHPSLVDMKDLVYNTRSQLEGLFLDQRGSTRLPSYADPLNNLFPLIAAGNRGYQTDSEIEDLVEQSRYPYKQQPERMIRMALSLGLLEQDTGRYNVAEQGRLGLVVLDGCGIHSVEDLIAAKSSEPLYEHLPELATFLRNKFASQTDYRVLFEILLNHAGKKVSLKELCQTLIETYPNTFLNWRIRHRATSAIPLLSFSRREARKSTLIRHISRGSSIVGSSPTS